MKSLIPQRGRYATAIGLLMILAVCHLVICLTNLPEETWGAWVVLGLLSFVLAAALSARRSLLAAARYLCCAGLVLSVAASLVGIYGFLRHSVNLAGWLLIGMVYGLIWLAGLAAVTEAGRRPHGQENAT